MNVKTVTATCPCCLKKRQLVFLNGVLRAEHNGNGKEVSRPIYRVHDGQVVHTQDCKCNGGQSVKLARGGSVSRFFENIPIVGQGGIKLGKRTSIKI